MKAIKLMLLDTMEDVLAKVKPEEYPYIGLCKVLHIARRAIWIRGVDERVAQRAYASLRKDLLLFAPDANPAGLPAFCVYWWGPNAEGFEYRLTAFGLLKAMVEGKK